MDTIAYDQIMRDITNVIGNVDLIYKQSHTRTEYLTYKLGKGASRFFKFMKSPQVKVFSLIVFWAMFVTSWLISAFAIGTVGAFIVFGLIIALYSSATAEAVAAIIKNTMFNYYSGLLGHVGQ
jgi:long-subunit acyl-CoA synthetase (AMP-forming)